MLNKPLIAAFLLLLIFSCKKETLSKNIHPIQLEDDWYEVSYLNPNTYIIEEPQSSQGNVSYLFLGETEGLMLDTGSGENPSINGSKMRYLVNQLTEKPTTLVLSHFHFDHNQNITEFDKVAFPEIEHLQQAVVDGTYSFTADDLFLGDTPASTQVDSWLPIGQDIDLGNRAVQLFSLPGHTEEDVAIVDTLNKFAFLGDYLYSGTLFLFDNGDIATYKETTECLLATISDDYRLFGAHGTPEMPFSRLEKLNDFLDCILNGICTSTAGVVWGMPVLRYSYNGMAMVVFQ